MNMGSAWFIRFLLALESNGFLVLVFAASLWYGVIACSKNPQMGMGLVMLLVGVIANLVGASLLQINFLPGFWAWKGMTAPLVFCTQGFASVATLVGWYLLSRKPQGSALPNAENIAAAGAEAADVPKDVPKS